MRKLTPDGYALAFQKQNGLIEAIKIADSCMKAVAPTEWQNIPVGLANKDKQGNWQLNKKNLSATYNFWFQVLHILKKKAVFHAR